MAKVSPEPNSGCWLWTANCNHKGYGQIGLGAKSMRTTHRVVYEHFKGPIPAGKQIMHSCDTPCCCNPDHLSVGTHQDNIDDKMRKRRHKAGRHNRARGSANGNSRLSYEQARDVKFGRDSYSVAASKHSVSKSTVYAIRKGLSWAHLEQS